MSSSQVTFAEEKESFFERWFQERYVLAGMGFWCFFVMSGLRLNISIGIVAMVNWTEVQKELGINPNSTEACHFNTTGEKSTREDGPFPWTPETQGFILGCYFYGLAATQLLGGRLAEVLSAKVVIFSGTLISTVCTLLIPVSATEGGTGVMVLQIIKGCGQGILVPSFSVMIGRWIPAMERARFVAFVISGMSIGAFCTIIMSGYICKISFLRWPFVFYIFGGLGVAWCIFWPLLVHDSPLNHPRITRKELDRIMSLRSQKAPQLNVPLPIRAISTSKPFWAYMIVGFASFWSGNLFISVIPLFMGTILKFDIEKNGTMSALPNLLEATVLIITSLVSDKLLEKKILSVTLARKLGVCIGLFGFALCMILVSVSGCNRVLSVLFFVVALGLSAFGFAAIAVVPVDMAPRFAGTISGMMSTIGALSGVIIPSAVGYLTKENQTLREWSVIFYMTAGICVAAAIIFIVFGSCEIQPWNKPLLGPSTSEEIREEEYRRLSLAPPPEAAFPETPSTDTDIIDAERPWRDPSFPEEPEERRPSVIVHY